jgi:hypothetical protein
MKNKNIMLLMLAITLVFGLTLMGCDEDNPLGGGDTSFEGDWSGNFTPSGEAETTAIITFTSTTWTFKAAGAGINKTGTYEKILAVATLKDSQGYTLGTATIIPLTETLTLNILQGNASGSGSFMSGRNNSGEFDGTWTGTFTPTGSDAIEGATIKFEDATWTLIAGSTFTGTYKQLTSETATLMQGVTPVGSVAIAPLLGNLEVIILTSDAKGTGNFKGGTEDSFKGQWTGTYKPSEGEEISGATINFTETTWTLTATGINRTGPYQETSLLPSTATATLKDNQGYTVGTASVVYLVNKLKVDIIQGTASGSGSFTRVP